MIYIIRNVLCALLKLKCEIETISYSNTRVNVISQFLASCTGRHRALLPATADFRCRWRPLLSTTTWTTWRSARPSMYIINRATPPWLRWQPQEPRQLAAESGRSLQRSVSAVDAGYCSHRLRSTNSNVGSNSSATCRRQNENTWRRSSDSRPLKYVIFIQSRRGLRIVGSLTLG